MIHEHELLGIVAKLSLGLNGERNSKLSLDCCIRVYDINNTDKNIVRDNCFVCNLPFDSLSITVNGENHKDWLEQMVQNEWITGFPEGYVNKAVKIKYHYDEKSVKRKTIVASFENPSEECISYDMAELIVSEIVFLDYPKGFIIHSNSKETNADMYMADIFKFATPYEVMFENLRDYPDFIYSMCKRGNLLTTANELKQVLGAPIDFSVDKSKYVWLVKMTVKNISINEFRQNVSCAQSYLFTIYDYAKNYDIKDDKLYYYHIGGYPMIEGDENQPILMDNNIYTELQLKLFKAKLMNKILEIRNSNVSQQ